jgi:hypothetical protein
VSWRGCDASPGPVRLLFILVALLLVPALALPFAERLRTEWARYWAPRVEAFEEVDPPDEINAAIEQATSTTIRCWIVVPALPPDQIDVLERERLRSEAERREVRNRQLAEEVADIRVE